VDCVINASIHQDLQSVEELGSLLPAWWSLLKSSQAVRVRAFSRWHVETQEQLFRHLRRLWRDDAPRVMIDLGCHAGHGRFYNLSDALLWLDHFSHTGSLVIGVDAFEDFALDLQHRFDEVEPYRSMRGVRKLAITRAIHATDGQSLDLRKLAQQAYGCCRTMACFQGMAALEARGLQDHVCRIPRQRLFPHASPSHLALPPSSHAAPLLAAARSAQLSPVAYPVMTTRTDTLWRQLAAGRRIDFMKVDVDKGWGDMGMERLFAARGFGVMAIEVDGYWGGVIQDFGVTQVDQLAWLADRHGYEPYIKVPCLAQPHVVSPAWDELSARVTARYQRLLRKKRTGFVPTLYSAKGRTEHNIQDLLIVDRHDPSLQGLAAMGEADCAKRGSMFVREDSRTWLAKSRGNATRRRMRRWLAEASPGYCDKTVKAGDCRAGSKGMLDLLPHEAMSWVGAAEACMRRCHRCERCHYVSLSIKWQDCSWYHSEACSLSRLHTDVPAFKTGARIS